MTNAHRSLFFASLTILSWSTVSTAFKLSLAAMTPLQMIAVSMTVGGLVFALVLAALRGELHSFRSSDAAGAVIAGPVIAVYYFVLFQGYSLLPAQVAQPINYTWSIVLAIMLCVAHREPLSVRQVFWMLTAWAGAALIAAGGRDIGHISPAGIGLMIFSTLLSYLSRILNMIFNDCLHAPRTGHRLQLEKGLHHRAIPSTSFFIRFSRNVPHLSQKS